ncbi:MAG TPA: hypothetical protein VM370_04830, partial [Candidatus Thermoplasmatota archaeon]|nr:hypothetical protein [Candidatus Thermoplasmatota archaeon]
GQSDEVLRDLNHLVHILLLAPSPSMLLAYEPTGEMALPSPTGVTFLGIEVTQRASWPALRHVFDLGEEAGLHIEVGPFGDTLAFGVGYTIGGDELLTAL